MTADTLAQVIYANLIEQYVSDLGRFQEFGEQTYIDGHVDLVALANAILKAQSDADAMRPSNGHIAGINPGPLQFN